MRRDAQLALDLSPLLVHDPTTPMMSYAPGRTPAALRAPLVVGALALLLAACRGSATQTPEDLPRGIAPGTEAPMTSREASRAAADREVDVGAPQPNVRSEGGIDVPADSSAAARNWQPREEEGDEGEAVDGEAVDGEEGDGEEEGDEGEGEPVDSEPVEPDDDEIGGGGPADRS
jgi:hypothetical protein